MIRQETKQLENSRGYFVEWMQQKGLTYNELCKLQDALYEVKSDKAQSDIFVLSIYRAMKSFGFLTNHQILTSDEEESLFLKHIREVRERIFRIQEEATCGDDSCVEECLKKIHIVA